MANITVDDYGIFFATDQGQRVLANMLIEGGFFKINKTPEEQGVENFLKIILSKTGRYPIEGESNCLGRAVKYVSGFRKRQSVKAMILNLFRMDRKY